MIACIRYYIGSENTVLYQNRCSNIQNIYRNSYTSLYWYNFRHPHKFISNEQSEIRVTCILRVFTQWYTRKLFKKHTGKFCSVFTRILSEYRRIHCKKSPYSRWLYVVQWAVSNNKWYSLLNLFKILILLRKVNLFHFLFNNKFRITPFNKPIFHV